VDKVSGQGFNRVRPYRYSITVNPIGKPILASLELIHLSRGRSVKADISTDTAGAGKFVAAEPQAGRRRHLRGTNDADEPSLLDGSRTT